MATVNVFEAQGSMALTKVHDDIPTRLQGDLQAKDLTGAVEIEIQKATINALLGAFTTTGGADGDKWANDTLSFPVADLVTDLEANNGAGGISTGALSTKLSDFSSAVLAVFAAGSETLFDEETFADLDHSFGGAQMLALMKANAITSGDDGNDLKLLNATKLLRDAVDKHHNGRTAASEVSEGFLADDRVFVEDGVSLAISVSFVDSSPASRDLTPANISVDASLGTQAGMSVNHTANLVLKVV